MEKIFFLISVVLILGFVLYLGGTAIMKGFSAKNANKLNEKKDDQEPIQNFSNEDKLSDELDKLNQLLKDGVLTQEEFEKAKKKILDN
tara:strand:- start:2307 stop:2570 length:264 start_codon:yes stop_codon:yes gene_type:complete